MASPEYFIVLPTEAAATICVQAPHYARQSRIFCGNAHFKPSPEYFIVFSAEADVAISMEARHIMRGKVEFAAMRILNSHLSISLYSRLKPMSLSAWRWATLCGGKVTEFAAMLIFTTYLSISLYSRLKPMSLSARRRATCAPK
jgi:hypothetical protein